MVTPIANTRTPTHGAQSPSRCCEPEKTCADGTPTACMPARMPNANSASCTTPETSRLDPETVCPAASSSTAVVSAAPVGTRRGRPPWPRSPGSVRSCFTPSAQSAETENAASTGISTCSGDPSRPKERNTPTSAPNTAAAAHRHAAPDAGSCKCRASGSSSRARVVSGPKRGRSSPISRNRCSPSMGRNDATSAS